MSGNNAEEATGVKANAPGTNRVAITAVCVLLALPAAYLAVRHTSAKAQAVPAVNDADRIATLEQLARTQPTADNRLNLSLAYINAQRPASASPILQALVAEDPKNAKAWNNLCVVHNLQSEFNQAVDACNRALAADSSFQLAANNLHWAQVQIAKATDAIAAEEKLPANARTGKSYLDEGMNNLHIGNYDRALEIWTQLAAREPNDAAVANDVGVAYMMKHQTADATAWFQRAATLDPTLQIAKNNLAWARSSQ